MLEDKNKIEMSEHDLEQGDSTISIEKEETITQQLTLSKKTLECIEKLKKKEFKNSDFGTEMWIDTDILQIDEDTQRGIMRSQVEKIIREFNPSSFGRLTVSLRKDGYYVTNGQHRLVALQQIGIEQAPCIVIENPAEDMVEIKKFDAVNFLEINQNSQSVKAIDKYRIGVSAQIPSWLNVRDVIEENGLTAGTTKNTVTALACIHRYINGSNNPEVVKTKKAQMSKALKILSESAGIEHITHISLQAVCILIREFVDTKVTTVEKIIKKFKRIDLKVCLNSAMTLKNNGIQKNVVTGLAIMLAQEYNNKCKGNEKKLPVGVLYPCSDTTSDSIEETEDTNKLIKENDEN